MDLKIKIPAFVFKTTYRESTTEEIIKRKDDVLEIEFPVFDKKEILKIAEKSFYSQ